MPNLEDERHVPAALLEASGFAGRIKRDGFGNAVFPHFDLEGLCGYEIKNRASPALPVAVKRAFGFRTGKTGTIA